MDSTTKHHHPLYPLCQRILSALSSVNHTLAVAESLTGGLVSARLTDVPGASKILKAGIVSYTNEAKHTVLRVPMTILDSVGPVSAECAEAMAVGVRELCGTEWGLATTGWAGSAVGGSLLAGNGLLAVNGDPQVLDMRAASPLGFRSINGISSSASTSSLDEDGLVFIYVVGPRRRSNAVNSTDGELKGEVRRFVFQRGGRWQTREDALKAALEMLLEHVNDYLSLVASA
ncbi:hypothetical protein HDU67_003512 [Dinochytrium kinnereticum]|nr:hypothetical protein HDU67_003512 [Dinochytrium kinnereticum]